MNYLNIRIIYFNIFEANFLSNKKKKSNKNELNLIIRVKYYYLYLIY